jgi:hypothetical protein
VKVGWEEVLDLVERCKVGADFDRSMALLPRPAVASKVTVAAGSLIMARCWVRELVRVCAVWGGNGGEQTEEAVDVVDVDVAYSWA